MRAMIKILALAGLATVLLLGVQVRDAAAATAVGKVTRVAGDVKVQRGGKTFTTQVGTRLLPADLVETGSNSKVKILMSDSSILSLGPNSKMRIRSYRYDRRRRQVSANYDLVYGRGRARVPRRDALKDIRFSTPGAVAGVRGTELIFEYNPNTGQTRIVAVDGTVTVINPNVPGETITLGPGMGTVVTGMNAPTSPFKVPDAEIRQLLRRAQVESASPRRVVVVEVPGEEVTISVEPGEGGGPPKIILEDSGTVMDPEDLIDQEPPPLTPVIINLTIQ